MINRTNLLKYYFLLSLAALDDEIAKLESVPEIIDYLKSITDSKIKGQVFNFVKSKKPQSLQEVKTFETDLLSKLDQKKNLQTSEISEELMITYNQLKSDKIKKYFRDLIKRKKIIAANDLLDKFNKIEHFVQENFKDTDITDYDFDKLYNASVKWEESFKQVKEVKISLDPSRIVYGPNWKKDEFNGHFIYELKTKEELTKEGSDLNHCVAGYAIYVEQGVKRIFSLRTSSNKPLLTIETSPDMFLFKQTFGFNNSSPNQIQSNMVNEWKQSLHPKEEIIELTESYDYEDKIQAAQFMDYNDPDYKNIIDKFVTEGKDSGKGYIGSQTENNPKDILQALSSNETLHEDLYDSIYMKAIKNYSTVHNLILNPSIHNDLYKMIYFKHDLNYDLKNTFCQSRKLAENEDVLKGLLQEKQFAYNIRILNNPSIKSSTCISIINSLSDDDINNLFSYDEFNNYEPKLIDDLLNSKVDIKQYLVKLIKYPNLSKDCLLKLYNLYKIKPILVTKEELLSEIFEIDKFLYLNYSNLSKSSITDEQLDFLIKTDESEKLVSLSKSPYLTVDQINKLLNVNKFGLTDIIKNLSSNPNLTKDQVLFIIRSPGYFNDLVINDNQNILRLALENKSGSLLNDNLNHSDKEFDDLLNKYKDESFQLIRLCNNYHLNNYKIQRLLDLNNVNICHSLGRNKFLHKDQINFLLNSFDKNIKYVLDNLKYNPDLNEEQTSILLDKYPLDKSSGNAESALYAGKLPNEEFISLFKIPKSHLHDDHIYASLAGNINLTEQQINMLLCIGDMSGYENEAKFLKELNDRSSVVSENLAKNPNLNSKHIDKLLEQGSLKINEYLSENENIKFNDLQFNQLLNEADQLAYNPNLTKEQCLKIIDKKPIALPKYFGYQKKVSQNYQFKSLAYYQGTEEPTPGKKQYKSDKAIVVQPRFKEPFYKNYDLYETGGEHSPGAGWHHIMKYKSIKEFLDAKRKNKYKADDSWIEDNGTVSKKARNLFFLNILIKNGIDFPIDDQITSMPIKEVNQIGGYLDKYLPENDSENKSPDKLNFGILEDEFSKENHKFLGLPDGIEPDEDLDADSTDTVNPEYGTTNSGNTLYNI